jgi:hypothetical protein
MSIRSGSTLNLLEFAQQWRHALLLWRRATNAGWSEIGLTDALPERMQEEIKKRAQAEAKPEIERLSADDKLMHSRLVLCHKVRAVDPLPEGAKEVLRHIVIAEREDWIWQAFKGRYRKIADRQLRFFKVRLLEALSNGAGLTARNAQGVLERLRPADVGDAQFDLEKNCLRLQGRLYHGVEIELGEAGATKPKLPSTSADPRRADRADNEVRFKAWADPFVDRGEIITERMARDRFPEFTVQERRKLLKKVVPENCRAKRGIAPSRLRK